MLTRATLETLSDKAKIRKLEDSLVKQKDVTRAVAAEKASSDSKRAALGVNIQSLEQELDSLRMSKRKLADECHKYQMSIHEKDNIVATRTRQFEEMTAQKNDRAFAAYRLSLNWSNAKNALAKKESEFVNLSAEYDDVCSQLKTVSKEREERQTEVDSLMRELTTFSDQLNELKKDKERFKNTLAELQDNRHQLQDANALLADRDEELSTMKRW